MTPIQHFDIRFTPAELDYIANVLMDRPHREVAVLLANIKSQVEYAQKAAAEPQVGLGPTHEAPAVAARYPNGHDGVQVTPPAA